MQTSCEVRRALSQDPSRHRVEHMRLDFGTAEPERELTIEEAAARSKARWGAALGIRRGPPKKPAGG